jgi:BlaI family penicillinase repressor
MALPRISDTEWEIMRVVWEREPVTASEIVTALQASDASWHPVTAKTLINRLVKKGALSYDHFGRAYVYRSEVTEKECVAAASKSFLTRVFDGSLASMVAYMVEGRQLNTKQIREIKSLLDEPARK